MDNKKTKVDCHLITRGTDEANAEAINDLTIADPEPAIGKRVIEEAMEEGIEDDGKSKDS